MSNISSVYVPDTAMGGGNNVESMLLGSMMGNGGGFGGNGMWNNPIWAIVFLAALRNGGIFGNNGWDGSGAHPCTTSQLTAIQETLNSNHGQTLLMDAIKGNANSIHELATTIGCNQNAVVAAINAVQSSICNVGNQLGMSSASIINAIQNGNMTIANQISQCCCDVKTETLKMGYENQINNLNQSNMITKGFGDVTNATQMQTTALAANQDANTRAVLGKLDQIEDDRKNREINALTAENATLRSRAERQAELAPIYQQLSDIKCKQPETVTVPYSPITPVPSCVAWNAALYGCFPYYAQQKGNVFS